MGNTHQVDKRRLFDTPPPPPTLNFPIAGAELFLIPEPFSCLQLGIVCAQSMLAEGMQAMVVE